MANRVVIVDSPEIADRGAILFPGATVVYANGSLPPEALGFDDSVVASADISRIATFCPQLAEQGSKVRQWHQDLSEFHTRQQVLDAANRITEYTPPAPPQENRADRPPPSGGAVPDPAEGAGPAPNEPEGYYSDAPPPFHSDIPAGAESGVKPFQKRRRPRLAAVDGNLALDPDTEPLPAPLSEDALAEHFVETQGDYWRYVPEWKLWLNWRGDGWHRDTRDEVADDFMKVTRSALEWAEARTLTPDGKRKLNSKRTAWNARDVAAVHRKISILAEELDADPMLLGVPGGVVDLRNGKLLEADPEQYITRRCAVAPEDGPHPLFDRVLARACNGHDGMREYLLRWFGYFLTGLVTEEAFMFLHGQGGSGKSTLIKALTEIMGDYATTISMDAFTESKHERHSQEIAKLEGSRLVYASETEEGRRFKESLIKLLTGGDKITAHRMRQDDREFKPTFKILIYGNSVPHLKSVGEEMRRRIHLIEYAGSLRPEERDHTLKERLVAEYPAILATLVRGCVAWQDCNGLGKPESVEMAVDEYLEGEDNFAAFLSECTESVTDATEVSSTVYRRYRSWCAAEGEYALSSKRFVKLLKERGFVPQRTSSARLIAGLRLRPAPVEDRPHWQRDD